MTARGKEPIVFLRDSSKASSTAAHLLSANNIRVEQIYSVSTGVVPSLVDRGMLFEGLGSIRMFVDNETYSPSKDARYTSRCREESK